MMQHQDDEGNFVEDLERASEAGKEGGQVSDGNFENNPQRAPEADKKGSRRSHGGN